MRKSLFSVMLVLGLSLSCFAAGPTPLFLDATGADNFKVLFVPKTSTQPKIDGVLDDTGWKSAPWVKDFNHCGYGARRYPIPKTEFKMIWDDEFLFVAIRCFEDSPENMKKHLAQVADRSKLIFSRDCVEVNIDGNNDNATRFQIWFIDTLEKMIFWHYDFGWGILVNENYGLSANWDYAVKQDEQNWTFEARIALANIQISPKTGTVFGANVTRFRFDKSGVRDDGKKSERVTQFPTWTNQGGSHSDARGFGKCILVDKMPKSVEDGLRLAYPDLNRRRLMVQTPQGFDVFNKGRKRRVSYLKMLTAELKKSKSIAANAEEAMKKDSEFAKNFLGRKISENKKTLESLAVEINSRKSISVTELNSFRKKLGKLTNTFEMAYWTLKRRLLLDGKEQYQQPTPNSRHFRIPRDEPENRPNPNTRKLPFVPWAKNWVKGKTKALIITAEGSSWSAYALKKRMDLDADIFVTTSRHPASIGPKTDYYKEGIKLFADKRRQLVELLRNEYDVIVFLDFSPNSLPYDLQYELTGKLMNGTGVVCFTPRSWSFQPRNKYKPVKNSVIIESIPWKSMTQLVETGANTYALNGDVIDNLKRKTAPLTVPPPVEYQVGKGLCVNFWPGGNGYFATSAITPNVQQNSDDFFQSEYYKSLACKIILRAAGKSSDAPIEKILCAKNGYKAGVPGEATAILAGASFEGQLKLDIRNKFGEIVKSSVLNVLKKKGEVELKLPIPPLPAGKYYVDAALCQNTGMLFWKKSRRVSWGSQAFNVSGTMTISCSLSSEVVKKGEMAAVSVMVNGKFTHATITASLRDTRGRVLWMKSDIPVNNGNAKFDTPTTGTGQVMNKLDVKLLSKGIVQAVETLDLFVTGQKMDDFVVFTDGGDVNYYGFLRHMELKNFGINMFELAHNPYDIMASGEFISGRYWMTHSDKWNGGSLANPLRLKGIKQTVQNFCEALSIRDGRFLSTGDDSGVAADFVKTYPNWVLPFVDALAKKYRAKALKSHKGYSVRLFLRERNISVGAFRYLLAQGDLKTFLNMKFLPGDFELLIKAFKEAYPDIAAFNRANGTDFTSFASITMQDLKKIKPSFDPDIMGFQDWLREKYGNIAKLNRTWGTKEKSFDSIAPGKVIPKLLQEGKYASKLDKTHYLEDLFIDEMRAVGEGVKASGADIGAGQGAASFNNIIPEVLEHTDTYVPYLADVNFEIGRSFPHRWVGQTLGVYGGKNVNAAARIQQVWHVLFSGGNFIWFWSASTGGLMYDLSTNPNRSGVMLETIKEARQGLASAVIRSERLHDGIAILHSRKSGHMSDILKTFGTQESSESSFQYVIEDLGLQYRYVSSKNIENGVLKSGEFKLLVLPYSQLLSSKEAKAIKDFVKNGGALLADMRSGVRGESGAPLRKGVLDGVFGISHTPVIGKPLKGDMNFKVGDAKGRVSGILTDASVLATTGKAAAGVGATPLFIFNEYGKGTAVFLNFNLACYDFLLNNDKLGELRKAFKKTFECCGIKSRFSVTSTTNGAIVPGVELALFKRGKTRVLTVEKKSLSFESYPLNAIIKLPRASYVFDMRTGDELGLLKAIPVSFSGLSCHAWSLLPYRVSAVVADLEKNSVSQGDDLKVKIQIAVEKGTPGTHVARVELVSPSGLKINPIPIKLDIPPNGVTFTHRVAVNDATGFWTLKVFDVLSGVSVEKRFEVFKRANK